VCILLKRSKSIIYVNNKVRLKCLAKTKVAFGFFIRDCLALLRKNAEQGHAFG